MQDILLNILTSYNDKDAHATLENQMAGIGMEPGAFGA